MDTWTTGTSSHGGAVYASVSGSGVLSLSKVNINNSQAGGWGGGLNYINTSTQDSSITGLTINNATAANGYGGGAYIQKSYGTINLSGVNIINTKAATSGGGIRFSGGNNSNFNISGSKFSNCGAISDTAGNGGAFSISPPAGSGTISSLSFDTTEFINCYATGASTNTVGMHIGRIGGVEDAFFTNCSFNNTGDFSFPFPSNGLLLYSIYTSNGNDSSTLSFINCRFNLKPQTASLIQTSYFLNMQNSTINLGDTTPQRFLTAERGFNLQGLEITAVLPPPSAIISISGEYLYQIKANSTINGMEITSAPILQLLPDLISASSGASITPVP
jgi:hypothetical protein